MRLKSKAMADHYREVADRYARSTRKTEYEVSEVVEWGLDRDLLEISPEEVREIHALRMGAALRDDATTDQHGRQVRLRYCVKARDNGDGIRTLWAHVDDATDQFLLQSLQQRRKGIKEHIASLRADLDFVNDRRVASGKRPFQMNLDDFNDGEPEGFAEAGN